MPLAEFLRLMAESHITLIHGKCGKLLKGQWHFEFGGFVWGFWLVYWVFFCLGFFWGWWRDRNDTEGMCVGLGKFCVKSCCHDDMIFKLDISKTVMGLLGSASSYTELDIMWNCTVRREKSLLGILESCEMPSQLKREEWGYRPVRRKEFKVRLCLRGRQTQPV